MTIDQVRLVAIFEALGEKLAKPATICLIGSSPGIVYGRDAGPRTAVCREAGKG